MNFLVDRVFKKYITRAEFYNILSLVSSNVFKYAINLYLSVVIVKYLGASLFGVFSYVHSITAIISVFSSLGLQSIVVREIVLKQLPLGGILGSSLFLSTLSGLLAAVLQLVIILLLNPTEKMVIYLGIINSAIFLFDTFKIYTYYYEAQVRSRIVSRINNVTLVVTALLKISAVYFKMGIYVISFIYALDYIISGILLLYVFSANELSFKSLIVSKQICLDLLRKSSPLILSGFFIGIYMKIDQVLIKNILGNVDAGIFAVVVRLTEIWYFIPVIIQSTLFPKILKSNHLNDQTEEAQFKLYKILIIFSLLVILFTYVFGSFVIDILFGIHFKAAFKPLIVSIWALLFVSIGVARNSFILSNNLNNLFLYSTLIGAVLNVSLNLIFLQNFGIMSASIIVIVSQFVSSHLSSLFFKKLRSQFFLVNKVFLNVITFNLFVNKPLTTNLIK